MVVKVSTDEVRRTVRTVLAVLVTVAALVPVLVEAGVVDEQRWPWVGTIVLLAGAVTRFMQAPAVDEVLTRAGVGREARVVPGEVVDPVAGEPEPAAGDDVPPPDPRYPPSFMP